MELNQLNKQNLTRNLRMGSRPNVGLATKQVELEHQNGDSLGQSVDRKQQAWISLAACGIQAGKILAFQAAQTGIGQPNVGSTNRNDMFLTRNLKCSATK